MLGFLMSEKEVKELEYLCKREMEEILFDLADNRIDVVVKRAMEEKYDIIFGLYRRVAGDECVHYMRTRTYKAED